MHLRRAIAPFGSVLQRTIALSFLAALLTLSGCRPATAPGEFPPSARMVFAAGDQLVYDGWSLNAWGYTVDSTKTHHTWDVLSSAASGGGYNDVIMIREETRRLRTGIMSIDTFLLRATDDGCLLRYGFLADLVRQREGRVIPRRWDTLAVLDERFWTVGVLDSAGQRKVSASVPALEEYFRIDVDGISSIFTARRVEMENEEFQYALWLSTAPPCFPRLEEAPDPLNDIPGGSLLVLRELWLAPR